ncbi:MAG: N-acetyltransferase family protein [Planctomycetota bacterium]
MTIREAVPTDADAIASIYNVHVDHGGATMDTVHWSSSTVRRWLPPHAPAGWYVATGTDDQVMGWGAVRPISERVGLRYTMETAIYLDPSSLGTGVADAIQNRLLVHCREHDIHHLMARIISTNGRSVAFHQRHGFEIVGVQREVGFLNDRWCDLTVMQRLFTNNDANDSPNR